MFFKISLYKLQLSNAEFTDVFLHTDTDKAGHRYTIRLKEYNRDSVIPYNELNKFGYFEKKRALDVQELVQKHFL